MIDIKKFSTSYQVRKLNPVDANKVFALVQSNPTYYNYCPPQATRHSILEDMKVVPADKSMADKYFVGFFTDDNQLVAVMDLISGYPTPDSVWIGFFMVDSQFQGKGLGSSIVEAVLSAVKDDNFKQVSLAYARGNAQSEQFLLKNKFVKTGQEVSMPGYVVVIMDRVLN